MTLDDDDNELVLDASMEAGGDDDDHGSVTDGDGGSTLVQPEEYSLELEGEEAVEETPLVKKLREQLQDKAREAAELRKAIAPAKIVVGDKPTLDGCEYDADRFETELDDWKERKAKADLQEATETQQGEVRNRDFQRRAAAYKAKLAALPLPEAEKDAAEKAVIAELPEMYQAAIIRYADDPAKVVAALGRYPQKRAELAAIVDGGDFIIAMRELERKLIVNRKAPPPPESDTVLRGSAPLSSASEDKKEKQLLDAASRDPSKFRAYRKYMREKKAAA